MPTADRTASEFRSAASRSNLEQGWWYIELLVAAGRDAVGLGRTLPRLAGELPAVNGPVEERLFSARAIGPRSGDAKTKRVSDHQCFSDFCARRGLARQPSAAGSGWIAPGSGRGTDSVGLREFVCT